MQTPTSLLEQLVAIPSVNPMGRNVSGPEYYETKIATFLESYLRDLGVPVYRQPGLPGRDNLIARYDAPHSSTTLLLDAHMDTVPVEGMIIPPFEPRIENGRLYGRGACDIKGGMAAMLAAFTRLVRERPSHSANVLLSLTFDEESTAQGAIYLSRLWTSELGSCPLITSPPDLALVAEPTDLDIVVAHRGATRWKIKTTGRAAHSSQPEKGVNAIYKMAHIVFALEQYAQQLPTLRPPHPLCGSATLSVGRIEGGLSVNTVPDECTIEIDRRVIPGENGLDVIPQVEEYLNQNVAVDFEFLPPWLNGMTLTDSNNGLWADRLMEKITATVGPRKKVGVPYGTNASRLCATGIPALVFGPGSIQQAHTIDEWIPLNELDQASEIYFQFCAETSDWK